MIAMDYEMNWGLKHFLDASATVKLMIEEPYSERIRDYFRKGFHRGYKFFMTPFCFYEALGVLKGKYAPDKSEEMKAKYFDLSSLVCESTFWFCR